MPRCLSPFLTSKVNLMNRAFAQASPPIAAMAWSAIAIAFSSDLVGSNEAAGAGALGAAGCVWGDAGRVCWAQVMEAVEANEASEAARPATRNQRMLFIKPPVRSPARAGRLFARS